MSAQTKPASPPIRKPTVVKRIKPRRKRKNTIEKRFRQQVFKRFEIVVCRWCGVPLCESDATTDHIIPLSEGGTDDEDNLDVACRGCNFTRAIIESLCRPGTRCSLKPDQIVSVAKWLDRHGRADPTLSRFRCTKVGRKLRRRWKEVTDGLAFPVE